MMVKYIQRIEFVAEYRSVGLGQGGWREDYQFYSPKREYEQRRQQAEV